MELKKQKSELGTYIDNYKDGTVAVTPEITINQTDIIKENKRNEHGVFSDPYFPDGTPITFYPIGNIFHQSIYRSTDLDIKDIQFRSLNGGAAEMMSIVQMAMHAHMKYSSFGQFLNEMRRELINGHVIVKMVGGQPKVCNLLNIVRPPVGNIQDTGCIEQSYYTYDEMKQQDFYKENKKLIDDLWKKMKEKGETSFIVYDWWKIDNFKVAGKEEMTKGCVKYLNKEALKEDEGNNVEDWNPEEELIRFASPHEKKVWFKRIRKMLGMDTVRLFPYVEQQLIKLQGRNLGVGVFELIRGIAKEYTKFMNQKSRFNTLKFTGIIVHNKSRNDDSLGITQEFLHNKDTGDVITLENDEKLTRLDVGSITAEALADADKLFELARMATGVTPQAAMEETPASITATQTVVDQKTAKTTYDVVIEQQELLLREMFENFYTKQALEDITGEDMAMITGDPEKMKEFEAPFIREYVETEAMKQRENNVFVSNQDVEAEVERVSKIREKQGDSRWANLKKKFFDTMHLWVEVNVSNESFDKNNRIKNTMELLRDQTFVGSKEKLTKELLLLLGYPLSILEKTDEEKQQEQMMAMQQQAPQGGPDQMVAQEMMGENSML